MAVLWDRDMLFAFASMLVGAYGWIVTEQLTIGIAMGIAMHALITLVYELCAYAFNWHHLQYIEHVLPVIIRMLRAERRT